jgi:hypothetical protein
MRKCHFIFFFGLNECVWWAHKHRPSTLSEIGTLF